MLIWILAAQMHAASSPDHARSPGKRERRTPHVISLTVFKIFGDLKVHPRIVPLSRCTNKRISVLSPFAAKIDGPLHNITYLQGTLASMWFLHMGNTCEHDPITSTAYMLKTMTWFSPWQVSQASKSVTLLWRIASDARKVGPTLGCVIVIPRCSAFSLDFKIENT